MISIRDANKNDVPAIVGLINAAFLVELFFIERDRTNLEMVDKLMESGKFLLAEDGPSLAGCVYVELREWRGYLGMLAVDPEHQRMGIGRRVLVAAESYFRDAGCRFSDLLIVSVRSDLLNMYRQMGYAVTGTYPYESTFPTKMPVHFIAMSKPLV